MSGASWRSAAWRAVVAQAATEGARTSNRRGGPALTATSNRPLLIRWLAWNDPNGTYTDADQAADVLEPLGVDDAWDLVAMACEVSACACCGARIQNADQIGTMFDNKVIRCVACQRAGRVA